MTRLEAVAARLRADPRSLAVLFGALAFYGLYWRVDVFIVDTFALANALANLAAGHLDVATIYYGPADGATPGMHAVDGQRLARNYGHVAVALPVLLALKGIAAVASVRVVLAGLWSVTLWLFADQLAAVVDDDRIRFVGRVGAVFAFGVNLALARSLSDHYLPLVALQLVTLLAAAGTAVVAYRLVALFHGPRVGTFAAVATAVVGPVGFWASIPKRHAITGFLVLATVYLFAVGRRTGDWRWRAAAYVPVGLTTWVAAHEGFVLFLALAGVDALTARRLDWRDAALAGGVLFVAMLPFFVTNLVLAGNPLEPPRMWPDFHPPTGGADAASAATGVERSATADVEGSAPTGSGSASQASTGADASPATVSRWAPLVTTLSEGWHVASSLFARSLASLDPTQLYHVFLRSGHIPGVQYHETGGETIELTLLESAPVLAALVAAPAVAGRRVLACRPTVPSRDAIAGLRSNPACATDALALAVFAGYALLYLSRLPLHSTITVRYLAPAVPALIYGVCRLGPVRVVAKRELPSVLALAAVGAGLLVVAVPVALAPLSPSVGTMMQVHALLDLAVAGIVASWLVAAPEDDRVGTAALSLTLAAGTAFLLLSGLAYFAEGRSFALPVARTISTLVPLTP